MYFCHSDGLLRKVQLVQKATLGLKILSKDRNLWICKFARYRVLYDRAKSFRLGLLRWENPKFSFEKMQSQFYGQTSSNCNLSHSLSFLNVIMTFWLGQTCLKCYKWTKKNISLKFFHFFVEFWLRFRAFWLGQTWTNLYKLCDNFIPPFLWGS